MFDFSAYRHSGSQETPAAEACYLARDGTAAMISAGAPSSGGDVLCEISMDGVLLTGRTAGTGRIQIYRGGTLAAFTADPSPAWERFCRGEISYSDIRLQDDCTRIAGDKRPSPLSADLQEGDGVLLATENFWRYLFEEEIAVDLLKSRSAAMWRDYLLVRLAERTHLAGGDFCVICCIWCNGSAMPEPAQQISAGASSAPDRSVPDLE